MRTKLGPSEKDFLKLTPQEKKEYIRLTPLGRMERMSRLFNDMIAFKAKVLGIPEREVYRRQLETDESDR